MVERQWKGGMPARIDKLPRDIRGFPVPWFVDWMDGPEGRRTVPVFQAMDPHKLVAAIRHKKCWICGEQLGKFVTFTIGPMCVCNRLSAEPPGHLDCSTFAVMNCPFLASPLAKRRPFVTQDGTVVGGSEEDYKGAGLMIARNPGVSAQWVTKSWNVEREPQGFLFRIGPLERLKFWSQGRPATRAEVEHSVETGLPRLRAVAREHDGPAGQKLLERQIATMRALVDGLEWERAA